MTGSALNWVVANAMVSGACIFVIHNKKVYDRLDLEWDPSTNWVQGGPIIEREHISLSDPESQAGNEWRAWCGAWNFSGSTPLIAAMRCYVASRFGDEVDVPEELV